jgi:hypothetical protein
MSDVASPGSATAPIAAPPSLPSSERLDTSNFAFVGRGCLTVIFAFTSPAEAPSFA